MEFEDDLPFESFAVRLPSAWLHKLDDILEKMVRIGHAQMLQRNLRWRMGRGRACSAVAAQPQVDGGGGDGHTRSLQRNRGEGRGAQQPAAMPTQVHILSRLAVDYAKLASIAPASDVHTRPPSWELARWQPKRDR